MLNAIKEDPEIINSVSKSEKQKLDVLCSIADNDTLPEKERVQAVHKIFETIDIGNQSKKDVNNRVNNNNTTWNNVLITVSIIGLCGIPYMFYGSIPTYEKFIKIASMPQKIGKDISKLKVKLVILLMLILISLFLLSLIMRICVIYHLYLSTEN